MEREEFVYVFEWHYEAIWRYLARLGGRATADDLAGEVFATAFADRHRYDSNRGEVRSWLYGIATNILHNSFRSERRAAAAFQTVLAQSAPVPDISEGIADRAAVHDQILQVQNAMVQLGTADREILVLAAWEELSYHEIAEVLDIPLGTVRSRLSRARSRLQDHIAEFSHIPQQSPYEGAAKP